MSHDERDFGGSRKKGRHDEMVLSDAPSALKRCRVGSAAGLAKGGNKYAARHPCKKPIRTKPTKEPQRIIEMPANADRFESDLFEQAGPNLRRVMFMQFDRSGKRRRQADSIPIVDV